MSIHTSPPFSTSLFPEQSPFRWSYRTKALFLGSCFSTSIGKRLLRDQFQIHFSPFGIVYDVSAMADQLDLLMSNRTFTPEDLVHDGELYHSFLHHGSFSGLEPQAVLSKMNAELEATRKFLQTANWLNLTWATTRSFTHLVSGRRTANNHQIPPSAFSCEYARVAELVPRYQGLLEALQNRYPQLHVAITISPVRYLQDGFLANTRSKSTLHLLAAELETLGTWTFPSYEILHDELRDYRYYDTDLIHPSSLATDLIYKKFMDCTLLDQDLSLFIRIQKIQQELNHRIRFPDTPSGRLFQQKKEEKVQLLRQEYPQYPWLFKDINTRVGQSSAH